MNDQMPMTPATEAADVTQAAPAAPAAALMQPYPAPAPAPAPAPVFGGSHAHGRPVQTKALPPKPALARWLVGLAVAGIITRLLIMAACANRISFSYDVLDGGAVNIDDANQADRFVSISAVVSAVAFFAFVGVLIAVRNRAKNGDPLCVAVAGNHAVSLTRRAYLISVVVSLFLRNAFKQDDSASAQDQIRTIMYADWASIAINAFVIAFLVVIMTVAWREITKAQAAASAA